MAVMNEERRQAAVGERTSLWAGLAVGLGGAALLGVLGLTLYLLLRRKPPEAAAPAPLLHAPAPLPPLPQLAAPRYFEEGVL